MKLHSPRTKLSFSPYRFSTVEFHQSAWTACAGCEDRIPPAILLASYGNRAYEDALVEMSDIMLDAGFIPVAAGAFPARHSIFPRVAKNRPDPADLEGIQNFARRLKEHKQGDAPAAVKLPGNRPYRDTGKVPFQPEGNCANCTKCGACARLCPVQAIPEDNPVMTDKEKCITCTACIYRCPQRSRAFRGRNYRIAGLLFHWKNRFRKQPEFFM